MSRAQLLALLLGVLLVSAPLVRSDEDYDDEDEEEAPAASAGDVVDVTEKNFEDSVANKKFALVAFTAPWCGHCKSLKPEWAKAATALKEFDADITIGNVDATVEKDLASKYGVNGYPTIKFFVDGKPVDYSGGRTSDDIVRWVKKKTGPAAETVEKAARFDELLEGEDPFVVGYFAKFEGPEYEAFVAAARQLEDAEAFQTTDKAVAAKVKLTKVGTAAAVRKAFGEWEYVSSDGHAALKEEGELSDKMLSFFKNEVVPVYVKYDQKSHSKIFGSDAPEFVFIFGSDEAIADAEKNVLKPTVAKFKGKAIIVSIDVTDSSAQGIMNYFLGEEKPETLAIMAWNKAGGKKFKGPEKVDKKTFDKFVSSVVEGTATPFFKSEPVPENPTDEGGLTKVTGKSFEDIVLDEKRDVLLEVYAPWCGHCKSLLPIYKKLAKRFKKVDSVVIAQVDGTANEHAQMQVQGFPTILFYPAGATEPINYSGERTLKEFTKFIKKNAKIPFELPKKASAKKGEEEEEEGKDEL